jgi:hypothetical protein
MKLNILMSCLFAFASAGVGAVSAQEKIVNCVALSNVDLNKLEKFYILGDIRVFYTEQAPVTGADHRLPAVSQVDLNANGVPDFIENVAKQADIARKLYNALGFRDPFESAKFRAVKHIDINMLNMAANGLAYDSGVVYASAPNRGADCTLRIDLSANLELSGKFTTNWFVASHEMFHLFQYGQTLFKRSWINEPLAKWAEYSLRTAAFYPLGTPVYTLPGTLSDWRTVVAAPTSIAANRFWSRLIDLTESTNDVLRVPAYLLSEKYTDGESVIKDATFRGAALISAYYQTLDAEDDILSNVNGWSAYDWPEADQTSASHDGRLLTVLQRVIKATGVANPELDSFLAIQ